MPAPAPAVLTAGTARVVITPPVGIGTAGFAGRPPSTGVHDDLTAGALVLGERAAGGADDGATRVALVALDLIGVRGDGLVAAIKAAVRAATGIPPERVFLTCSHTHYGPELGRDREGGDGPAAAAYRETLPHLVAGAVAAADAARERLRLPALLPVSVEAGHARVAALEADRARLDREGVPAGAGARVWNTRTLRRAREGLAALEGGTSLPPVEAEIGALRVGEAALVSTPAELFCALGLAIKAASPFPFTAVAGYTDGSAGYVPTRAAYPEGGYEVDRACRVAPEAGELIADTSVRLLRALGRAERASA